MLNWDDIRIMLMVARSGSTNAAARGLDMNQTTVARRIDTLEKDLGLELFRRDTRGYHTTEEAAALLGFAESTAEYVDAFEQRAAALMRSKSAILRLTAAESVHEEILDPILKEYRDLHPELKFEYDASDRALDLEAGEADIAFRGEDRPTDERLICRRLSGFKWAVYCAPDYPEPPESFDDLARHPVALFDGPMGALSVHRKYVEHIDPGKVVAECNTLANMRAIIRRGEAIGLLSCDIGDHDPDLLRCISSKPVLVSPFWLLVASHAYRRPEVRDFVLFAGKRFNKRLADLQGPPDQFS